MEIKNKKVLIFIPKLYHGGGAERSSLALKDLLSRQYNVETLTIHDAGEGLEDHSFCRKDGSKLNSGLNLFADAKRLKKFCEKNKIEVVMSNMPRANTTTMFSNMFFGNKTKNILITRNANLYGFINRFLAKIFWNKAEHNVAVSSGSEKSLKSIGIKNTSVIFNPFDIDGILEKSKLDLENENHESLFSGYTFINIGRLHKQKGQGFLIDAFYAFDKKHPNTKLIILGEGGERERLENRIENLNLKEKVFLLGNIKNVYPYLRKSDTFVLSSLWEGLPTVIVESAILGKNIVTSDCVSGPREILSKENILDKKLEYPYEADGGIIISDPKKDSGQFKTEMIDSMERYYLNKVKTDPRFFTKKVEPDNLLKKWNKILS